MANDPVYQIYPYHPDWAKDFVDQAKKLREILEELALRIDHIGSTSVPGLAAKDIVDIQITVRALGPEVRHRLEMYGYQFSEDTFNDHIPPRFDGPESFWEKWFVHPPEGTRHMHIHIRVAGNPNQVYPILFRDYLRTHPSTAEAYAELKRRLVANLADLSMYPEVKDPAVDLIYFAAQDWARQTSWVIPPTDG